MFLWPFAENIWTPMLSMVMYGMYKDRDLHPHGKVVLALVKPTQIIYTINHTVGILLLRCHNYQTNSLQCFFYIYSFISVMIIFNAKIAVMMNVWLK